MKSNYYNLQYICLANVESDDVRVYLIRIGSTQSKHLAVEGGQKYPRRSQKFASSVLVHFKQIWILSIVIYGGKINYHIVLVLLYLKLSERLTMDFTYKFPEKRLDFIEACLATFHG